jgi:hypothetical protein
MQGIKKSTGDMRKENQLSFSAYLKKTSIVLDRLNHLTAIITANEFQHLESTEGKF